MSSSEGASLIPSEITPEQKRISGLNADISFAGCGFNGVYHVGVVACLVNYAPELLGQKVLGSSAGALAGAAIVGKIPLDVMVKDILNLVVLATERTFGPFSPSFKMNEKLKEGMMKQLPEDIHELANNRLYVSITKIPSGANLLVNTFTSKADLVDALAASSFVPTMSGWMAPKFRGEHVWDGGYSDNLPVLDNRTVTVSPFAGDASICPEDSGKWSSLLNLRVPHNKAGKGPSLNVSLENASKFLTAAMPPGKDGLLSLCAQGYQDAMRYLTNQDLIRCAKCYKGPVFPEPCRACDVIKEEATTKTLPQEIQDVFEEFEVQQDPVQHILISIVRIPIVWYDLVIKGCKALSIRTNLDRVEVDGCPFSIFSTHSVS